MKNLILLSVVFLITSCTKEIYRGEVSYKNDNRSLIQLYGTGQSVWSEDPLLHKSDIVEVESRNNFKKITTKVICSPVLDHCHYDGSGAHVRVHIKNDIAIDPSSLTYNDADYTAATMQLIGNSASNDVWIEKHFDFSDSPIFAVFLLDEEFEFQIIEGRFLILDYTTEDHAGH